MKRDKFILLIIGINKTYREKIVFFALDGKLPKGLFVGSEIAMASFCQTTSKLS